MDVYESDFEIYNETPRLPYIEAGVEDNTDFGFSSMTGTQVLNGMSRDKLQVGRSILHTTKTGIRMDRKALAVGSVLAVAMAVVLSQLYLLRLFIDTYEEVTLSAFILVLSAPTTIHGIVFITQCTHFLMSAWLGKNTRTSSLLHLAGCYALPSLVLSVYGFIPLSLSIFRFGCTLVGSKILCSPPITIDDFFGADIREVIATCSTIFGVEHYGIVLVIGFLFCIAPLFVIGETVKLCMRRIGQHLTISACLLNVILAFSMIYIVVLNMGKSVFRNFVFEKINPSLTILITTLSGTIAGGSFLFVVCLLVITLLLEGAKELAERGQLLDKDARVEKKTHWVSIALSAVLLIVLALLVVFVQNYLFKQKSVPFTISKYIVDHELYAP